MGLRKFFKIKPVIALLFVFALQSSAFAQEADTAKAVKTTAAADTAAVKQDTGKMAAPLISTDIDTTTLSWTGGGADAPQATPDQSAEYKSIWYYVLLFILFCVFLGIVGKVIRLYELSRNVNRDPSDLSTTPYSISWNRIQGTIFGVALVLGIYGAYWSYTVQGPMSVTPSASLHGQLLDTMFNVTLVITTIVFILTHILLFGFSFLYAGSSKRKAYFYPHTIPWSGSGPSFRHSCWPGWCCLDFLPGETSQKYRSLSRKKQMNLEIIGEQFNWNIRYSGNDNQLGLRNYKLTSATNALGIDFKDRKSWDDKLAPEIVLPVNKPVRVSIGSKDILHSFYIPDFKAQINAVPGMATYFQFTPTITTADMRIQRKDPGYNYILLCAKICGEGHYNMQRKVTVVSEQEYKVWLAKQPLYYNDDVKKQLNAPVEGKGINQKQIALIH